MQFMLFIYALTHSVSFKKSLKTFFFTTITQKAHKTYSALEGADVGVLWSYMVEATGVPEGKPPTLDRQPLPATCRRQELILGRSSEKRGFYPQALYFQ